MRLRTIGIITTAIAACRSTAPTPSTGQLVTVQGATIVSASPIPPSADTSMAGRARRDAQARANAAAARVVAINVSPARLELTVGARLPMNTLRAVASDSAGRPVNDFAPSFSVQDNSIVSFRGGVITGLEPGTTNILVRASTFPMRAPSDTGLTVRVPVTVTAVAARSSVTRPPVPIDSMVPAELVRYLLGNSRVVAGQPISALDASTLRNAYIFGSRFGGFGDATIASYPWTRRATMDSLGARLTAVGWTSLPSTPPPTEQPGFQSSSMGNSGMPTTFCRDRQTLMIGVVDTRGTETVISFTHQGAQARSMCDPVLGQRMGASATDVIPSLPPYPDSPVFSRARSSGPDEGYTEAYLQGTPPASAVLEHYTRLLVAAGWTPGERTSVAGIALATFTFRDSGSRPWGAILTVASPPGSRRTDLRLAVRYAP